jgi:diphosphomevalonate decarboxylase
MRATAVAHPNVALAKYWGKRDVVGNVPATPSLSVSLGGLETRTTVTFDPALERDELRLNDRVADATRVTALLAEVRALAGIKHFAHVDSWNDFPTASGLASSASGFAALAVAAAAAAKLSLDDAAISRIARRASASAARSVFGGFVALGTEDDAAAEPIEADMQLAIVVAAVTFDSKATGSTSGMNQCRATSPYYPAWVEDAPRVYREVREAIDARDLERLGHAAELSALRMHASMLASDPPLLYWTSATLDLLSRVRALRNEGVAAWATIDAGPHVKVICAPRDATRISQKLAPAAVRTIIAHIGGAARVLEAS